MSKAVSGTIETMLANMVPDDAPAGVDSGDPKMMYHELSSDDVLESGVWSATVGGFKVPPYTVSEVMVMLKGRMRLTAEDGTVTELSKGDMFYIPKGWTGRWDTLEDMQKAYTIVY